MCRAFKNFIPFFLLNFQKDQFPVDETLSIFTSKNNQVSFMTKKRKIESGLDIDALDFNPGGCWDLINPQIAAGDLILLF